MPCRRTAPAGARQAVIDAKGGPSRPARKRVPGRLPDDGNRYGWTIRQLFITLYEQIDQTGIGLTIRSPLGVFMPGCDPVQPDVIVLRTDDLPIIRDRRIAGIPALLIEVLSPSNAVVDTAIKRKAYARAGAPECWIIRPAPRDALV